MSDKKTSIVFVCMGNICRSPMAEGVFGAVVRDAGLESRFVLDSAGTGAWHAGNAPDERAVQVLAQNGIDISAQQARQIVRDDFARFDLVLALDHSVFADLQKLAPREYADRVQLFLRFVGNDVTNTTEVPDPYYGGADGFIETLRLIEMGSRALLEHLRS